MPRLCGQQFEILQLCPAVTVSEGMDVVHIADDLRRPDSEILRRESLQEARALKPPMNVGHAGVDEPAKLKLRPALADLDGADLAGPLIDVLKQVMMDGSQMVDIETTGRYAFSGSLRDQPSFDLIENFRVSYAEKVPENMASRIDIRVVRIHFAACPNAFDMM